MRLLYPCNPFERKQPDEEYADEFDAAQTAGFTCSLYSAEDFEGREFRPRPALTDGEDVLYRGWMFTPIDYASLHAAIETKGGRMLTSPTQYRSCHYLPEWYDGCKDDTPKTVFLAKDADFQSTLADYKWSAYFVKDYVKSLTTSRGSVAANVDQIPEIVALIEKFRGQIEGGICVRQFEDLRPETEERYFAFKGKVFSRDGVVPEMVESIASRIDSPFFSIDVAMNTDGALRLIELGDGQVSDRKQWPAAKFVELLRS